MPKDVDVTKLFFATDIHGSDICWSKFLNAGKFYEADVLILGGDMTGKAVVPIIHQGGITKSRCWNKSFQLRTNPNYKR
jgi:Icc-related predicted phosphoesterase